MVVTKNSTSLKVCFVCLDAFGLFYPQLNIPFGGAQYRSYTLASGLARYTQCKVSFLVYDYGQGRKTKIKGISVFRTDSTRLDGMYTRTKRLQRRLFDRINAMLHCHGDLNDLYTQYYPNRDLLQTGADVFCIFGLTPTTLKQLRILRKANKKVAIFLTHDEDVALLNYKDSVEINRHGIKGDIVWQIFQGGTAFVCQNQLQLDRLKDHFNKRAFLLNNPIDTAGACPTTAELILWVGRDSSVKRPKLFLELAKAVPDQHFVMILNPSSMGDFDFINQHKPENLELIPHVPATQIESYFRRAKLLVNTSTSEGFPNTFLQAGKYGVPVATLGIDPNGMISKQNGGYTFRDIDEMICAFQSETFFGEWGKKSAAISEHIRANHGLEKVTDRLMEYLREL